MAHKEAQVALLNVMQKEVTRIVLFEEWDSEFHIFVKQMRAQNSRERRLELQPEPLSGQPAESEHVRPSGPQPLPAGRLAPPFGDARTLLCRLGLRRLLVEI